MVGEGAGQTGILLCRPPGATAAAPDASGIGGLLLGSLQPIAAAVFCGFKGRIYICRDISSSTSTLFAARCCFTVYFPCSCCCCCSCCWCCCCSCCAWPPPHKHLKRKRKATTGKYSYSVFAAAVVAAAAATTRTSSSLYTRFGLLAPGLRRSCCRCGGGSSSSSKIC